MACNIREAPPEACMESLIALSVDWEAEQSCYGYRKNTQADIEGNRVWLAEEDGRIIGYLFGHMETAKKAASIIRDGTLYFEVEELYVRPAFRSQGIGKQLFQAAEEALRREGQAEMIMLSTATKNWKAIFRFYLDEMDMTFWSARLYKALG